MNDNTLLRRSLGLVWYITSDAFCPSPITFFLVFLGTLPLVQNFVGFVFLAFMDLEGPMCDVSPNNPIHISTSNIFVVGGELRAQGKNIPPAPFFLGFPHHGSQMPFLYPHSFMPPLPGVGFAPLIQGARNDIAEFATTSQKRFLQECATNQFKFTKKQKMAWNKPVYVELDNVKKKVEYLKSVGHWNNH